MNPSKAIHTPDLDLGGAFVSMLTVQAFTCGLELRDVLLQADQLLQLPRDPLARLLVLRRLCFQVLHQVVRLCAQQRLHLLMHILPEVRLGGVELAQCDF